MKTNSVTINNETYTLALTMDAFNFIIQKVGGTENISNLFATKNIEETYLDTLEILAALLAGGRAYVALAYGRDEKEITLSDLKILCSISDCMELRINVMEAVALGMSREVEVETEIKNAETTQMSP